MNKLLLIGPCTNKKDPSKTGGVIVLFEDLIHQIKKRNIDFFVIDTNKANNSNVLSAMVMIYLKTILFSFKVTHISLHGTAKDYIFIAPLAVVLSKVLNKKCSLRKFAGNFDNFYKGSNSIKKKLIEYVLRNSDVNFFETKYLVSFFQKYNHNTFWFPNVREKKIVSSRNRFRKKFIFISQLYKSKGVNEILEASNMLPDEYIIDLYGPLKDDYRVEFFDSYKANYRGALKPNEVLPILSEYDVLILASYYPGEGYPGEGYPGVVIEALSVGKPVIVTDLESIKEMVDISCAVFVKPRSAEGIKNAILGFDCDNYISYASNALSAFDKFDSEIQTSIFLKKIGI